MRRRGRRGRKSRRRRRRITYVSGRMALVVWTSLFVSGVFGRTAVLLWSIFGDVHGNAGAGTEHVVCTL